MRIHRLTFQAIGPYPGEQDLAFEQLDEVGLFLLDGPTGAGKSTILDVITFALYGKADDERKNTEFHSTLAEPGTPPTIKLDVSFGHRRFVIDRVLQHTAPRRGAKNADDVVTRQASMALSEVVAGEPQQLTTRVDEAQHILGSVIGLTREQFTSVVLLPQGDFARFLKASSNDREAILRQLFNTHRFDEIGDYLSQQAKKLRGAVEADSQRREDLRAGLLHTAQTYATPSEETPDSAAVESATLELDELTDAALIAHVEATMSQLAAQALRRVERSTTGLESAAKKLVELQEQQSHIREATDYRQRRHVHEEQTSTAQTAKQQLAHHLRAQPVVAAQGHADKASQQLSVAVEQWQQQLDAGQHDDVIVQWAAGQDIFVAELDDVQALVDGWKTVEAAAIRGLEQVQQHEKTQTSITAQQHQVHQWQRSKESLTAKRKALDAEFATVSEKLVANRSQAEELSVSQQTLETAKQQLVEAQAKRAAANDAQTAQAAADTAEQTRDTTKQAAETALEHAQGLLRRRIDAAAGFLAEQLAEGEPCEVCGSTTHPQPAEMQGLAEISNAAVTTADDQATAARRAANAAEQTYQRQLTALHQLQTRAGGRNVADADAAVSSLDTTVTKAQQDTKTLTALRARIKKYEARIEAVREETTGAERQLTEATTQITSLTKEFEQSQQELTAALGAFDTVAALRAAVEPAHRLVGQIVAQGARVSTALTGQHTAAARVAEALAQSATDEQPAFDDAQTAKTHLLDAQTQAEHEALVRQWTTEKDRLAEKSGQTAVIAGSKLIDDGVAAPSDDTLATARQHQQTAQTQLSQANREHGSIQTTHEQAKGQQRQLDDVSKRSAEQRATYEALLGLSEVVAGTGENATKMPLRSFVLAGWLEQVAANASERLTGMTGGRYELKHDVGQGGRGHAGLNLKVIDHLNDTARNPATLSGGETFMASLALALGLADAVQAQAGGVAMDTLFIDEGFGSLDADTLEDVMGVLDTLQHDGRLIGLVSHVESMKQQIPHRIQVQKSQTGSSVTVIGPDLV